MIGYPLVRALNSSILQSYIHIKLEYGANKSDPFDKADETRSFGTDCN